MYLYGASVQGIQGFIFETNKLKEIVGASDLIEWFCSEGFLEKFSKKYEITIKNVLRNAGGNIRITFDTEKDVTGMVKNFPQYIMQKAYGITLSQAVVQFSDGEYLDKKDELEYKLTKARNQASMPLDARFSLMKQTPRTGKPAFEFKDKEYFDKGNGQKKENTEEARVNILLGKLKLNTSFEKFPLDMDEIAKGNDNNKIAIIHADGNRMGLMLQQMNQDLKDKSDDAIQKVFKEFSTQITKSTNDAVKEAFESTFNGIDGDESIPFRPIVIGGDDVTVVCHADKALEFTQAYLRAFEKKTKENFKKSELDKYAEKLTACAGVSFCNKKFPFHYAYTLADKLCTYAKETSKRESSCLVFHNIQSSFVNDYATFIKEELITKENIKLLFSPYHTEKEPKIDTLIELHKLFSDSDIPLGKYREWLSELHKSQEYAELFLERVDALMRAKVDSKKYKELDEKLKKLDSGLRLNMLIVNGKTPMQDIMQLKAVIGGNK